MRHRSSIGLALMAVAFAAVIAAGCGGDDNGGGSTTAAETGAAGTLTIDMGDFFFEPKDATASAGSTTISAPNVGQVEHEFILAKSDVDPASLPVSGDRVDEDAFVKQGAEVLGEIEDVPAGQTKEGSFDLTPGKYVMFCNLPAHYAQGMYGSLTVE